MASSNETLTVKDAVYKLQLSLLDTIKTQDQLFAAGSIISRRDYQDVVVERSITSLCGYPLCPNSLPADRPRKGKYRISIKEHKVYDQQETYMYCSSTCLVNSRAFATYLQDERPFALNSSKLSGVLRLFDGLNLDENNTNKVDNNKNLIIHEKNDVQNGDFSIIGPSNAIEGYVPQRDRRRQGSNGVKNKKKNTTNVMNVGFSEMDFMSDIIMNDGYDISKLPPSGMPSDAKTDGDGMCNSIEDQLTNLTLSSSTTTTTKKKSGKKSSKSKGKKSRDIDDSNHKESRATTSNTRQSGSTSSEITLKPSLKSAGSKKLNRSVTWADKKNDESGSGKLCEVESTADREESSEMLTGSDVGGDDDALRVASAEACARALSQAAEAVASGSSDTVDAVTEAGIIVLPQQDNVNGEETVEDVDRAPAKWPRKPEDSDSEFDDPDDTWFDDPPEEFSLALSPFATMFGAIFEWTTSCSLAYIYGRDESDYGDYLMVNGREYPRKVIMVDGRSSEIKQTLGGCLERVLPGLISDLRVSTSLTILEKETGRLVETMSFGEALPAFRMKQWHLIVLLFLEALSVCRIPTLASHFSNRRVLLEKVLDGAEISVEQYEAMRDILLPLGRAPHFSSQCGA
ncbi:hypothetical protein ACFE04_015139 [Oxalis oulophora]